MPKPLLGMLSEVRRCGLGNRRGRSRRCPDGPKSIGTRRSSRDARANLPKAFGAVSKTVRFRLLTVVPSKSDRQRTGVSVVPQDPFRQDIATNERLNSLMTKSRFNYRNSIANEAEHRSRPPQKNRQRNIVLVALMGRCSCGWSMNWHLASRNQTKRLYDCRVNGRTTRASINQPSDYLGCRDGTVGSTQRVEPSTRDVYP